MAEYPIVGLALGSGGARGLAHAGVLAALEEAGIRPDRVAGTSMGAIVGGLYAQDPDPARVWRRLQAYVDDEEFASYWAPFVPRSENHDREHLGRIAGIFDFMQRKMIAVKTVTRPWQQDEDKLRGPLATMFGPGSFADLKIPFAAVALDLVSGERVVFREGALVDGVYASSAIPGVFPPLRRGPQVICDGGGPYRCPVEAVRDLGAELVVAVDIPAFEDTHFSTGLDMILRSNTIARQRLNEYVVATADFVIRPEVTDYHWADFANGSVARDRGYEAGKAAVPALQELLRERRSFGHRVRRTLAAALRLG
ncbi:MAG TPA: patatin-like phospholipase family protein [Candidatus Krumholzibacteria bacterium]|nr:patatin-like phospholipase family protein [Candidatus Krumholzibacteria bacterium]